MLYRIDLNFIISDFRRVTALKIRIGVIGSAVADMKVIPKARQIGVEIARRDNILLTGSGPGIPYEAVKGAKETGGFTIGFSPASHSKEHKEKYNFPADLFDVLIFTGFGLKGRNVPFIRTCDGVVVISGRIGTLNEFTIAFDEGKVIGLLKGTGGLCDNTSIENFVKASGKKGGKIVSNSDPKLLIKELLKHLCSVQEKER